MNASEAIRFVANKFLDTYSNRFDQDTYENIKLLLEHTPSDKLIPKIKKLLENISKLSEKNNLKKQDLINAGFITQDTTISKDEIVELGKQAEIAYNLCVTIHEMDPEKLKEIEGLASQVQHALESKIKTMSEEERNNLDPMSLATSVMGSVEGCPDIGAIMQSMLGGGQPTNQTKMNLLEQFNQIDGKKTKKR